MIFLYILQVTLIMYLQHVCKTSDITSNLRELLTLVMFCTFLMIFQSGRISSTAIVKYCKPILHGASSH